MIFVSNTIQYNAIDLRKEQYLQSRVSFLGFPTPEQGDKFKTLVAHTRLIKVEFPPPPPRGVDIHMFTTPSTACTKHRENLFSGLLHYQSGKS